MKTNEVIEPNSKETELLNLIYNSTDPKMAMEIAIQVITSYLDHSSAAEEQS